MDHRDVGDVCCPHLVGSIDLKASEQVGISAARGLRVRRNGPGSPGCPLQRNGR